MSEIDRRAEALAREPVLWAIAHLALATVGEAGAALEAREARGKEGERARAAVTETLAALMVEGRDRDLQAGRFTREHLVRALLGHADDRLPPDGQADPHEPSDPASTPAVALRRALSSMSIRERTALGLVEFDDLSPGAADDLVGEAGASARAQAQVDVELERLPRRLAASDALRQHLGTAVDLPAVAPGSVVADAEALLSRRRTRARAVGALVAVALIAVVALLFLTTKQQGERPAAATASASTATDADADATPSGPGSASSTEAGAAGAMLRLDGVTVQIAPSAEEEAALPFLYDAPARFALPTRLGFEAEEPLMSLTEAGPVPESVRAVLLRRLGGTSYAPVLYVPDHTPAYLLVDTVTLDYPSAPSAGEPPRLSTRTISDDRHRLGFVQADGVVLLDVVRGTVTRVSLPDKEIRMGGWVWGSTSFIAESAISGYRIDPATGAFAPVDLPVGFGRRSFSVVDGTATLLDHDWLGRVDSVQSLPGPIQGTRGGTVDNIEGWSASGVTFLPTSVLRSGSQGLYAVFVDVRPRAVALVSANNREPTRDCCRAQGWASQTQVLYESRAFGVVRLISWDVDSGEVRRVSELVEAPERPGAWSGDFVLSP